MMPLSRQARIMDRLLAPSDDVAQKQEIVHDTSNAMCAAQYVSLRLQGKGHEETMDTGRASIDEQVKILSEALGIKPGDPVTIENLTWEQLKTLVLSAASEMIRHLS